MIDKIISIFLAILISYMFFINNKDKNILLNNRFLVSKITTNSKCSLK